MIDVCTFAWGVFSVCRRKFLLFAAEGNQVGPVVRAKMADVLAREIVGYSSVSRVCFFSKFLWSPVSPISFPGFCGYRSKCTNNNYGYRHLHVHQLFQISGKVLVFLCFFAFFCRVLDQQNTLNEKLICLLRREFHVSFSRYYYYYSLNRAFHITVSRWFFTGVWVTPSLLKSPGLFSVFWPFSIMLSFGWSPPVRQLPSPPVPLVIL